MKPRICILKTDGTNCDQETAHAFVRAGGQAEIVLLNQLRAQQHLLSHFQVLVIPGGFSYGDDIASGKLLALELMTFLYDQLNEFIQRGNLIIGICNGFQVLVRAHLLPQSTNHQQVATLLTNDSGKFECRWVSLKIEPTACIFTQGLAGTTIMLPIAHAEGKFFAHEEDLDRLEAEKLVVLRYGKGVSHRDDEHPYNPNGSLHDIAGICNPTGRVFGLMPHPERFVYAYQHPLRTRQQHDPIGLTIFKNAIAYAQQM